MSNKGIFCLINNVDKRIYISFSNNVFLALATLLNNVNSQSSPVYVELYNDLNKLEFKVLDTTYDNLRIGQSFYVEYYEDLGYNMYNNFKGLKYKVRIEPNDKLGKVAVVLQNRRKEKVVVAVFDSVLEAEEYVKEKY